MTIEIPEAAIRFIEDHAREAYPEECCGFLIGHVTNPRVVVEARRAKNVATDDRRRRYSIDPIDLLRVDDVARKEKRDLIGIYHSHPDHPAAPSEFDRSRATGWYTYVILRIQERVPGDLTAWIYDETARRFRPEPLVRT